MSLPPVPLSSQLKGREQGSLIRFSPVTVVVNHTEHLIAIKRRYRAMIKLNRFLIALVALWYFSFGTSISSCF